MLADEDVAIAEELSLGFFHKLALVSGEVLGCNVFVSSGTVFSSILI